MKKILLSIAYLIVLLIILAILSFVLNLFIESVLFPLFNWFNSLHWAIKIVLYIFGFGILLFLVHLFQAISGVVNGVVLYFFPFNLFTVIATLLLVLWNCGYLIVGVWRSTEHYSFWVVMELLFVSAFIMESHSIFFHKRAA